MRDADRGMVQRQRHHRQEILQPGREITSFAVYCPRTPRPAVTREMTTTTSSHCCSLGRTIRQPQHQQWLKRSLAEHNSKPKPRRGSLVGQDTGGECSWRVETARLLQAQHHSQDAKHFPSGAASLLQICSFSCCCNINSNDCG